MNHPIRYACLLAAVPLQLSAQTAEQTEHVDLPAVNVTGQSRTASRDSYTVPTMSTATGLPISPKDTPQSVSVITRKQMDDSGATTLEDALKTTTGLNVVRRGNRMQFQSRGFNIGSVTTNGLHSTIASMQGNNLHDQKLLMDTALYERIEILRGASGLKQADSEPGGSVNAILKRPTAQPLAEIDLQADRWGKVRGVFDVSGVLNQEHAVRGRMVGVLERDNSFRKYDNGDNAVLFGTADKTFGNNTKLTVGAVYHRQTDTPLGFGLPIDRNGSDLRLPRDTNWGADWNKGTYRKIHTFAELEHYFGNDWKLTGKLDYKQNKSKTEEAYLSGSCVTCGADNGMLPLDTVSRHDRYNHQWTGQAELNGKYSAFGRRHDLYAAYTHSREKFNIRMRDQNTQNRSFNLYTWTGGEIARPDWNSFDYQDYRNSRKTIQTLTLASRLNLTDRLHLILGGGYSRWRNSFIWYRDTKDGVPDYQAGNDYPYKKGRFIPYAAVTYDLDGRNTLYASYTSIFKHTSARDKDDKELSPVLGNNYEIGWKGAWNGGRLNTTLAFFQTEKHNEPISTRERHPETKNWIYAPVRLQSRGFDAEIAGDLTPDWQLFAGYTYNTRKYTATAGQQQLFVKGADFSQHTPKHMFRLYTTYRLPGAANRWTLKGGFNMQDKHRSWDVKQPLGGYTVWNAGVQYQPNKKLNLGLTVNNLTDKRYYENYEARTYGWGYFYGEPRNVVFNLKWTM